ncbi:adenylate/guanylate cyclase domain-containing protein [Gemmatimonas sp.]|uniref:adenylate/guanylate cyclase domain-containing protein n=1 Tax=Gemmatimonas sp. TaxID=1962908 RepID=UPI0022C58210|nr:adenylate/guanylate cyclase domain-containing protein [Gemmatimonas sp.]MCZ8203298.1 FHA domain-containing protein [Gemmatimonas sp.]
MPLILQSVAGDRRFSLAGHQALVVGRDPVSDLPILDPAVSRRHAELRVDAREPLVHVTDFGSRNGTWINNARITRGLLRPGDRIAFGTVAFTLAAAAPTPVRATPAVSSSDPGTTRLRERVVPSRDQALADVARDTEGAERATQRLTQLVRIAQRLGAFGALDGLLEAIASELFDTFDADRVAILLSASDGQLETKVSRDRRGAIPRPVPRAIAHGVAERQVALLTNDASSDARTAGESVLQQSVKSAMAAPLIGEHRATIGVLYVDHLRDRAVFDDDDLALLVAFAAIAAAAVERETAAEQLTRATRVRENFERYFTPQIAERIAATTHQVEPGGTRLPVVVMFSDIRGFTAIAESLPPMHMANQLNEYFTVMVECVFRHGGALDKFIGDAIMAYWGAPEARDDDIDGAVAAAFDMQGALEALNARWREEGRPELHIGIGIHHGDAFVGNIGSPRRLEFTLIGDTVNVASRLCSLAQADEVLVSEPVVEHVSRSRTLPVHCRSRDDLRVLRRTSSDSPVWQVEFAR